MNKAELQHQIRRQTTVHTAQADCWIKDNGLSTNTFAVLDIKLLQAQQMAHWLLDNHLGLLSANQVKTLQTFQYKIKNKHIRNKLKPHAAYSVMNIGTKIKRKLYSQSKH